MEAALVFVTDSDVSPWRLNYIATAQGHPEYTGVLVVVLYVCVCTFT